MDFHDRAWTEAIVLLCIIQCTLSVAIAFLYLCRESKAIWAEFGLVKPDIQRPEGCSREKISTESHRTGEFVFTLEQLEMPFSRLLSQDDSPFFQKLPIDVRVMIYEELLSGLRFGPILAGLWLQQQETSIILDLKHRSVGYPRVSIDATILRTCMLAYTEAALVLYSRNTIGFNNASQIADFRSKGLSKVIVGQNSDQSQKTETVFTLQPKSLGRLSNIVCLYLVFTQQPDLERAAPWHHENRELIMEAWSDLLFQERQRDESERFSFPALTFLALDFEPFKLKSDERMNVRPFARLFERSSLLEKVYIIGVTYKPTIRKLRACLLPNGGVFKIFNWNDGGPGRAELVEASDEE